MLPTAAGVVCLTCLFRLAQRRYGPVRGHRMPRAFWLLPLLAYRTRSKSKFPGVSGAAAYMARCSADCEAFEDVDAMAVVGISEPTISNCAYTGLAATTANATTLAILHADCFIMSPRQSRLGCSNRDKLSCATVVC